MTSCADVCLDMDYDNDNEFYSESRVKARKSYHCSECREAIPIGAVYERAVGKCDGRIWTNRTCSPCSDIRKAFVCGSWQFGELWEHVEEVMFPIWNTSGPIDCLAKLETLEARDKARERYKDWKGDQR